MKKAASEEIIQMLEKALEHIKNKDFTRLGHLTLIHSATVFQDEYLITISVIIWSLSKIGKRLGELDDETVSLLKQARKQLLDNKKKEFHTTLTDLTSHIQKMDHRMDLYVQEIMNRGRVKEGSNMLAHGISLARAADILGLSQWDLMSYVGKTNILDKRIVVEDNVRQRMDFLNKLFRLR